jgi:hypothetical protein
MKLPLGPGKLPLTPDWSILVRALFQLHYWLLLLTVTTQTTYAVATRRVFPRNTDTTQTDYTVAAISDKPGTLFLNSHAAVRS